MMNQQNEVTWHDQQPRLSAKHLNTVSSGSAVESARTIVHLGIGAFHRAHQAVYTQLASEFDDPPWKIVGVSLRRADVRDQLDPQDNLYTLVQMDESGTENQIISSVKKVLVAPENPDAVLQQMSADDCHIISLTITEKGYCHEPATGNLDLTNPDIVHDLSTPSTPKSALGYIVESLRMRRDQGRSPITVLCCDNLPDNGHTLRRLVVEFAAQRDEELASWILDHIPFPNTMVDRIVPATHQSDIDQLAEVTGYVDQGMVKTERFSQWVIEDNFVCDAKPAWDKVGADLVEDVEPYELAKLRLLNGSHSSLSYLGFLAGYDYVDQVVGDEELLRFIRQLMLREIAPTLTPPDGLDLDDYIDRLLHRFANPSLKHKTYQIAMDGSQKLPQRLLGTVRDRLQLAPEEQQQKAHIAHLGFALAGWIRYALAYDENGQDVVIQDPMADRFQAITEKAFDPVEKLMDINSLIDGFLSVEDIFGNDLATNAALRASLTHWLGLILANGVKTALKIFLAKAIEIADDH